MSEKRIYEHQIPGSPYEGSVLHPRLDGPRLCPKGIEHIVDLLGKGDCPTHAGRMLAGCDPHQCSHAAEALGWENTDRECEPDVAPAQYQDDEGVWRYHTGAADYHNDPEVKE